MSMLLWGFGLVLSTLPRLAFYGAHGLMMLFPGTCLSVPRAFPVPFANPLSSSLNAPHPNRVTSFSVSVFLQWVDGSLFLGLARPGRIFFSFTFLQHTVTFHSGLST